MAVVKTVNCSNGVVVNIHDDLYAGITEEEMNRRIREIKEFAEKIVIDAEVRKTTENESHS